MSWLTAEGNPCNHALLLDRCLSRLLISQEIPYGVLVYLSHRKEIKCAFRFIAESGLQANASAADLSEIRCHDVWLAREF